MCRRFTARGISAFGLIPPYSLLEVRPMVDARRRRLSTLLPGYRLHQRKRWNLGAAVLVQPRVSFYANRAGHNAAWTATRDSREGEAPAEPEMP